MGEKLPVSFFDHKMKFNSFLALGIVGSERFIEYFLKNNHQYKDWIFFELCHNGHLSAAQWFYKKDTVEVHAWNL
jgi:hypothetical protein